MKKIILTEKKTFEELGSFGLNEKGKYEAQTGNDDIAMTLINLVAFFDNNVFSEMVEDVFDKQPQLYKQLINKKINEAPQDDTIENLRWMKKYM